jgi:Ca2+-binding EF-hand superfamily protein
LSTTVSTFIPDRLFDFLDENKDGMIDMNEWHRLR